MHLFSARFNYKLLVLNFSQTNNINQKRENYPMIPGNNLASPTMDVTSPKDWWTGL